MQKSNVGVVLVISVLMSFIMGAIGGFIVLDSASGGNTIITHNGVVLEENDTISVGVEAVYDSVVVVEGITNNQLASTGTGFIYKENNNDFYIMTNHHVISGVESVKVILSDGEVVDAKILGSEVYSDIAVLSISSDKVKGVAVMGDSSKLSVGDTLFTVGAPSGVNYAGTVTKGVLSGKDRLVAVNLSNTNTSDYYMKVLQTDAAINPGNSGGPICNINGEVVGITNLKLVDSSVEGIGFAIPVEDALFYAASLEKGQAVVRPYIGIGMLEISDTLNLYRSGIMLSEDIDVGVVVTEVASNSPASAAKLQKGDVIISLGGETIESVAEFRYELYKHEVGEEVEIEYIRNNKVKKTSVKLVENKQ